MHSQSLFLPALLLITIGCKNDAAEREKALAERERDLARKELEALKAQQAQILPLATLMDPPIVRMMEPGGKTQRPRI